jgi:DNA-binding CsgD family transcriptional regulator
VKTKLHQDLESRLTGLSVSAKKVVIATIAGLQTKEIAQMIGTSDNNVRHVRSRVFRKYEVRNYRELVLKLTNPELYEYCIESTKL